MKIIEVVKEKWETIGILAGNPSIHLEPSGASTKIEVNAQSSCLSKAYELAEGLRGQEKSYQIFIILDHIAHVKNFLNGKVSPNKAVYQFSELDPIIIELLTVNINEKVVAFVKDTVQVLFEKRLRQQALGMYNKAYRIMAIKLSAKVLRKNKLQSLGMKMSYEDFDKKEPDEFNCQRDCNLEMLKNKDIDIVTMRCSAVAIRALLVMKKEIAKKLKKNPDGFVNLWGDDKIRCNKNVIMAGTQFANSLWELNVPVLNLYLPINLNDSKKINI